MREGFIRRWIGAAVAIATAGVFVGSTGAGAVSLRVKLACSSDYYAFCSQYPTEGAEVRRCMRSAGEKLSHRCINALVAEGEVSQTEVTRRAAH